MHQHTITMKPQPWRGWRWRGRTKLVFFVTKPISEIPPLFVNNVCSNLHNLQDSQSLVFPFVNNCIRLPTKPIQSEAEAKPTRTFSIRETKAFSPKYQIHLNEKVDNFKIDKLLLVKNNAIHFNEKWKNVKFRSPGRHFPP